jgi:hypothetical protein
MTAPTLSPQQLRRRFVNRGAGILAAVFMVAFATVQLEENGARGLIDGKFVGVDLLVGFFAFRTGKWLSLGVEALTRSMRERGK